ncbi:MAG: hypothetical protein GF320_09695 [Armatimonadia bacterium]|nr:hypothetical protein [Armatimonadia bacterium]
MAVAVILSFVGGALLIAAAALWDLIGPWALPVAVPVAAGCVYVLIHSLPLLTMSARLRPLALGSTMIRSARRLSEDQQWELFRLVDLVKGRLWDAAPGAESAGCEVWVVAHRDQVQRVVRARRVGVGLFGPTVCAIAIGDLRDHERALKAIASAVAVNAASSLNGRIPPFLREGLGGYLVACALHPAGAERGRYLHEDARRAAEDGVDLAHMLRLLGPSLKAGQRRALARSLVGFLVHRYGWRAFLQMMQYADREPIDLALFEAYARNLAELQRRWLVFLEGSLAPLSRDGRRSA